jgi:phenylpyruvate tautomerase PptA (4-oxalocrotonate tautomerase family)
VTDVLSASAGVPKESVWIVFEDIPATEWYVGARSVAESTADE